MIEQIVDNMTLEIMHHQGRKSCIINSYNGKVHMKSDIIMEVDDESQQGIIFWYSFNEPSYVKVYEEYLIYDTLGMIGSVGGTLGLFIGFSFMNVITFLINTMEKIFPCNCTTTLFRHKDPINKQIDATGGYDHQRFLELEKRMSQLENNLASRQF